MGRTLLILGGIGLVCVLLIARLFFTQGNRMEDEREWFAKSLRYEFSAVVDSVSLFNENGGRILCRLTSGDPKTHREDSLKRSFKEHDMLYLIFVHSGDSITFIHPQARLIAKGDSVSVSSEKNTIQFFREGEQVASHAMTDVLTGFGRPFFLKGRQ